MKARIAVISLAGFLALAFWLNPAAADTQVTVSALVPTTVSAAQSSFVSNIQTLPADGSTRVTLTATLVDDTNIPVPNSSVTVSSNRGGVDTILCYQGTTLTSSTTATSDSSGVVRCIVTSKAPGQATFSARVDDQITLNDRPVVSFTALPIAQNVTVIVTLPGGKEIVILRPPQKPEPTPATPVGVEPSHNSGDGQLVNTGIRVELSLGSFIVVLMLFLLIPALLVALLLLLRRQKQLLEQETLAQTKTQESLNKIAQTEEKIAAEIESRTD